MDPASLFNQRKYKFALVFLLRCNLLFSVCWASPALAEVMDPEDLQLGETNLVFKLLTQAPDLGSHNALLVPITRRPLNEIEADEYENEDETTPAAFAVPSSTLTPPSVVSETFSTTTLGGVAWTKDSLRRLKEKNRRDDFKKKILESVRFRTRPVISAEQRKYAMDQIFNDHNNFFTRESTPEQRNCYLATCAVPKSTNEDIWKDVSQPGLRLNFNLPRLDRKHEEDEVRTARLNLFIKPRKDCPCVDEDDKEMSDYLVTIYQFVRPLSARKRNKVVYKQKILNAVMVPAQGNAWITIDIKRAVTTWMKKTRKNFGVEVTVQDSYGTAINAKEIFVLPICSSTTNERACRDGVVKTLSVMPWTVAMTRDEVVNENIPYVDVVTTDKSLEKELQEKFVWEIQS